MISDGNTKNINSPIFCNLNKFDIVMICQKVATVSKTIEKMSDDMKYRIVNHIVLNTEYNFRYTLLLRSSRKPSKCLLDKDIVCIRKKLIRCGVSLVQFLLEEQNVNRLGRL